MVGGHSWTTLMCPLVLNGDTEDRVAGLSPDDQRVHCLDPILFSLTRGGERPPAGSMHGFSERSLPCCGRSWENVKEKDECYALISACYTVAVLGLRNPSVIMLCWLTSVCIPLLCTATVSPLLSVVIVLSTVYIVFNVLVYCCLP